MAYFGNEPADNFTAITKDTFSGDGSTTAFTLTNPATTNGVQVFVENVRQEPTSAYSVSGTTLTFTAAPVSGTDNVYVVNSGTPVSTATHPAGAALQATTGTFSGALTTTGSATIGDGLTVDNDGATVATFDRATSNGTIVDLQKDGTQVGSIGTYDTDIHIGSGDVGLSFYDAGDTVLPFNPSTPVYRDNAIGLGNASNRFKDLYLSGGVYLGGTGAANYLTDYEYGTWTPVLSSAGGDLTATYSGTLAGEYVKIGRLVFCSFALFASSISGGSGNFHLGGLPFTSSNSGVHRSGGPVLYNDGIISKTSYTSTFSVAQNVAYAIIRVQTGTNINNIDGVVLASDVQSGGGNLQGSFSYVTS